MCNSERTNLCTLTIKLAFQSFAVFDPNGVFLLGLRVRILFVYAQYMIVYVRESEICMIHRCNVCPGIQVVQNFLMQFLKKAQEPEEYFESDENEELTIDFKKWIRTDRTDLLTVIVLLN